MNTVRTPLQTQCVYHLRLGFSTFPNVFYFASLSLSVFNKCLYWIKCYTSRSCSSDIFDLTGIRAKKLSQFQLFCCTYLYTRMQYSSHCSRHSPVKPNIFHYITDFSMTSKFANLHSLRLVSPGGCLPVSANFCQSTLISHSKLKEKKTCSAILKKTNKISVIISLKVLMLIRFNFKYRFGNRSECQRTKQNQQKETGSRNVSQALYECHYLSIS